MPSYSVRFLKAAGERAGECRAAITVEAPSECEAVRRAMEAFARSEHVAHWSDRADGIESRMVGAQGCPTAALLSLRRAAADRRRPHRLAVRQHGAHGLA